MRTRARTRGPLQRLVASLAAIATAAAPIQPAFACGGPPPPPAMLGAPESILIPPGGGPFDITIPALVYLNLFGPGCATPPFNGTIELTVSDASGAGGPATLGTGGMTSQPISVVPGQNLIPVTITVGPTPQRTAMVTATASVSLTVAPFGVPTAITVSDTSENGVCFVDARSGMGDVPRLEMTLIDPMHPTDTAFNGLLPVHPSAQVKLTYRITNWDLSNSFTGTLSATSTADSRLPTVTGDDPVVRGSGVISPSDPVQGDHFPIGMRIGQETWGLGLLDCVPLPPNPRLTDPYQLMPTIALDPGESIEVDLHVRTASGKCADGSCSNGRMLLQGSFSNSDPGLACAGYGVIADTSQPPSYDCPGSGAVLRLVPRLTPRVGFAIVAQPHLGVTHPIDYTVSNLVVTQAGNPLPPPFEFAQLLGPTPTQGRHQLQWFNPSGLLTPGATIQIDYDAEFAPGGSAVTDITDNMVSLMPDSPTGFDHIGPFAVGGFTTVDTTDGRVAYMAQVSGRFSQLGPGGETVHRIVWDSVAVTPLAHAGMGGFHFSGTTTVPAATGDPFVLLEVYDDLRGYASPDVEVMDVDQLVEALLGIPTPISQSFDLNMDNALDSADIVTFVNTPPGAAARTAEAP